MRFRRWTAVAIALSIMSVAAMAQETDAEGFLLRLTNELQALGWSDETATAFRNQATGLDWTEAAHSDPRLLAWALAYGMSEDALAAQEQVQVALALALRTAEMTRLGYSSHDVASAAVQAARAAVETTARIRREEENPQTGALVRNRINDAIQQQTRTATRVRTEDASGPAYRIGESEPGVPVFPDDPPSPGQPAGPGDGTADGGQPAGPRS